MALPLPQGLVPSEVAFLCEMELVTVVPRQRLESIELLSVGQLCPALIKMLQIACFVLLFLTVVIIDRARLPDSIHLTEPTCPSGSPSSSRSSDAPTSCPLHGSILIPYATSSRTRPPSTSRIGPPLRLRQFEPMAEAILPDSTLTKMAWYCRRRFCHLALPQLQPAHCPTIGSNLRRCSLRMPAMIFHLPLKSALFCEICRKLEPLR